MSSYKSESFCEHSYICDSIQLPSYPTHIAVLSSALPRLLSEIVVSNSNVNQNENFSSLASKDQRDQIMEQFNNNFENPKIGNFSNQVSDNARQQSKQENYVYEKSQDLASAAEQIQKLLRQLEQDNPAATDLEKVKYVTEKADDSLKQRFIRILAAGGESALEEYLDNSYVKIVRAMVRAWISSSSND
jgi:predicted Zn-dependent protease